MRRFLVLLLALLLLLCSCKGARDFEMSEDGEGYLDKRSGLVYFGLPILYEAAATGEVFAEFEDERGTVHQFFEIPELSTEQFLSDEYQHVYLVGEDFTYAEDWTVDSVLFCQENAISVVWRGFYADKNGADVTVFRDLWFEGEASDEMPITRPDTIYSVKFTTSAYENLMYSISFYYFEESGAGYLYSSVLRRSVAVPSELLSKVVAAGGGV